MIDIKRQIFQIPLIGAITRNLCLLAKKKSFTNSSAYWEQRYASGKNSGIGSYNELAYFKAEVLNNFVKLNNINSVIEFGCGDGNQLLLSKYPSYIGLDVSVSAISLCISKFKHDLTKSFFLYNSNYFIDNTSTFNADLALSLDVIYHLVEDEIFNTHLQHLFSSSNRYVIIYSTDEDTPDPYQLPHVRRRSFSGHIAQHFENWALSNCIPNKYALSEFPDNGSDAKFYIYERK